MVESSRESAARSRTRLAILDAAVRVLGADKQASLTEIAEVACVGRSTLHRYFPERADLIKAMARHVLTLLDAAVVRAQPDVGDPVAGLRRLAEQLFDLGPILMYLYAEPLLAQETEFWAAMQDGVDPLDSLFAQMGDLLRPDVPVAWARRAFWALVYAGWEAAQTDGTPRQEIIDMIMSIFGAGVMTRPVP